MAKKIWPWVIGTIAVAGIGGGLAYAFRRVETNLHTYMTDKEYADALVLPEDAMIVVVAYNPGNPLASNVQSAVASSAAANREVHYIVVSDAIGSRIGMDLDGVWGRVDAGHDDVAYTGGFGPQTSANDIAVHMQAATAAVRSGAAGGTTSGDDPDADDTDDDATDDGGDAPVGEVAAGDQTPATAFDPQP